MRQKIAHTLDPETARRVARAAAAGYLERFARFKPSVRWLDEDTAALSFAAKGVKVTGQVQLVPGAIFVELKVPLLLRPLTGRAQEVIEGELVQWAERAERGEV